MKEKGSMRRIYCRTKPSGTVYHRRRNIQRTFVYRRWNSNDKVNKRRLWLVPRRVPNVVTVAKRRRTSPNFPYEYRFYSTFFHSSRTPCRRAWLRKYPIESDRTRGFYLYDFDMEKRRATVVSKSPLIFSWTRFRGLRSLLLLIADTDAISLACNNLLI